MIRIMMNYTDEVGLNLWGRLEMGVPYNYNISVASLSCFAPTRPQCLALLLWNAERDIPSASPLADSIRTSST